jgi:hypothetical protein
LAQYSGHSSQIVTIERRIPQSISRARRRTISYPAAGELHRAIRTENCCYRGSNVVM